MGSSGMLCRVDLVRTDVSEELSASFIRVTRIGELGTTLASFASMWSMNSVLFSVAMFSVHTLNVSSVFQVSFFDQLKNGVFWDVTPCGSCKNGRFRGT
jgi:hypothetical protein